MINPFEESNDSIFERFKVKPLPDFTRKYPPLYSTDRDEDNPLITGLKPLISFKPSEPVKLDLPFIPKPRDTTNDLLTYIPSRSFEPIKINPPFIPESRSTINETFHTYDPLKPISEQRDTTKDIMDRYGLQSRTTTENPFTIPPSVYRHSSSVQESHSTHYEELVTSLKQSQQPQDSLDRIIRKKKRSNSQGSRSQNTNEDSLSRIIRKKRGGKTPVNEKKESKTEIPQFNLKGELELGYTFLDSIENNEKIFIYSNNKLFTLDSENQSKGTYFLRYKGIDFLIEPQEDLTLTKLESDFIQKNKDKIEEFQRSNIQALSQEYSSYRERITNLKGLIKERFTVEQFISKYVFGWYRERKKVQESNGNIKDIKIPEEKLEEQVKIPEIDFSDMKESALESLVNDFRKSENKEFGGILFMLGRVYYLPQITKQEENKTLELEQCTYLTSQPEFNTKYKERLKTEIKKRVSKSLQDVIKKVIDCKLTAESISPQPKEEIKHREGELGFYKKEKDYTVFLEFPDFIIEKKGKFYLLPNGRIEAKLTRENGSIILDQDLYAFSRNGLTGYDHLFIYSDGKMCQGRDRTKEAGIRSCQHKVKDLDKQELARNIIDLLEIGKAVITQGYTGTHAGCNSHALTDKNISSEEAKKLQKSGIQIYQNGGKTQEW